MNLNRSEHVWLFDFDLTLYGQDEAQAVLHCLDRAIEEFISAKLGVNMTRAAVLREKYWRSDGTTVAALMRLHNIDPDEYFDYIHRVINVPKRNPALTTILSQITGRRMVFSNGRLDWVTRGLGAIGIGGLFETIYDLKRLRWQCKPSQAPFAQIEQELGVHPSRIILLDDSCANLATAKRRGWNTVWVHPNAATTPCVWTAQITTVGRIVELL